MRRFPCFKCGRCCQLVGSAPETRFLDRGDGVCRFYSENDHLCSIYESRPEICRIDIQYAKYYSSQYQWDVFVRMNLDVCEKLDRAQEVLVDEGMLQREASC